MLGSHFEDRGTARTAARFSAHSGQGRSRLLRLLRHLRDTAFQAAGGGRNNRSGANRWHRRTCRSSGLGSCPASRLSEEPLPGETKKVLFRSQHEHQVCLKQTSLIRLLSELRRQPGGLRQLYRGAAVVLLRAFPANAATFIGWGQLDLQLRSIHPPFRYEWTMRVLLLGLTHTQKGEGELLKFAQKQNEDLNSLWWQSGFVDI